MPTIDNEYSTPKITPAEGVKIPSVGSDSGYQLDEELREYIQNGVTGVDEQYSTLMTYAYGKRLKHEGVEYRCIVPVESPEIFDPDKWAKVDLTELDKRVLDNADAINAISTYTDLNVTLDDSTNFSLSYARVRYYPLLKIIFVQIRLGSSDLSSQRYQPITISLPKNLPFAQMLSCTGEEHDGGYFDMTLGCWVAQTTGKVSIDTRGNTFANPRISGILVY